MHFMLKVLAKNCNDFRFVTKILNYDSNNYPIQEHALILDD